MAAQVQDLHATWLTAKAVLDKVDGTAHASAAEQRAAEAAARLSTSIGDYASARLASAILSDVIETYQERHQEPMLARASELFAAITDGKFTRVAADFEEEKRVLVGVRDDGRRERIPALSSGRRDQLFLALRLAAIESHVASQGPVPVVVDDIVINFDDAAAGATFKVLAELSQKTQVLFFTHHEHLLERAANVLGAENFNAQGL
ncbi:ATP-binding protein [Acidiferrobacter sp.]